MASISKNPPCVRVLSLMAFVLAASVAVGAAAVESWHQFRGLGGQGISRGSVLPTSWAEDRNGVPH